MYKIIRVATVPVAIYKLLNGQLRYLCNDFEVKVVCSDGVYLEQLKEQEGVEVVPVRICREINIVKDVIALFKLIRLFRKEKPMIVHSHTPKAGLLAMVAARVARVPIRIHMFTGLRFETTQGLFRKILVAMDKVTCACATEIIPEGDGVKKCLVENKITTKQMSKIANGNINGIDTSFFNPEKVDADTIHGLKSELGISDDDLVFCFVGRLVRDKGIKELVDAFSMLTTSSVKLLLVGPMEEKLDPLPIETIERINTDTRILSVGLQQDVRKYLAISHVFTFVSYREGFPNVLLQAGAMGIPSIVSDISGSNEIIIEDYNGLIVPPKNLDALLESMKKLYQDRGLLYRLAENSRKNVVEKYQREYVWEGIRKRYMKLIEKSKI